MAALATWASISVVRSAAIARKSWGERRSVVQMLRRVPSGVMIGPNDIGLVSVPLRLVPPGASMDTDRVIGQRTGVDLEPGDLVIAPRLHPQRSAVAARTRTGRGVAVPRDERMPPLEIGDPVEVVDPMATGQHRFAGVVIDVNDRNVTIEASPDAAIAIASAVAHSSVAVLLRP